MRSKGITFRSGATLILALLPGIGAAAVGVSGQVLDLNGNPVAGALVTVTRPVQGGAAYSATVFTGESGRFAFPTHVAPPAIKGVTVEAKALGYRQVSPGTGPVPLAGLRQAGRGFDLLFVMRAEANKAATAPASAWLQGIPHSPGRATVIKECVSCHQFPTPEVRRYAVSLNDVPGSDSMAARKHTWGQVAAYMSRRMTDFFQRGMEINASYLNFEEMDRELFTEDLAENLPRRFDVVDYAWGAPLAVTEKTVIREYAVPDTSAIREAVLTGDLAGDDAALWVVDTLADRLVRIDPDTGAQRDFPVPLERASGPDMLLNGSDGSIWVAMLFGNLLGRFDPTAGKWHIRQMRTDAVPLLMPHDIAFNWKREAAFDAQGRLWFADTANNAVVAVDPETGAAEVHFAPAVAGRTNIGILMYGAVMSSDGEHIWYTQLGGNFGSFDIQAGEFRTAMELPPGAGPRRLAISERDILYVPLFGHGRIVEYDTRARKLIGVHDLPDRGSAPYAVTWDPRRQVLWVATANADAIYRFDPATKGFTVLPLPRRKAFLRMLDVDPSGVLVTSYANLPETADGPRMGLLIEPGDDVR